MRRIQFAPGAVTHPTAITLPTDLPDIDVVVSAEIIRIPAAQAAHAHDFISTGIGGAVAEAMGLPATLDAINDAGAAGAHTVAGGGASGVQNSTALTGADPIVAATPTKVTSRTFSLDVDTELGDILRLSYQEVGVLTHP